AKTRDSTDEVDRTLESKLCETIQVHHIETEFYKPEKCFSRTDIQKIILELVWTISDVFVKHHIEYWLDSGTLLGSFREKTVIPYDNDADVGIAEDAYFRLRDEKFDIPPGYELHVFEAKHHKRGNRDAAIPCRLIHTTSGMYVDIFVFVDSKTLENQPMFGPIPSVSFGRCHHCSRRPSGKEFKIPKSWVYPLQLCEFGGRSVTCPARPTYYLRYLFGPNYMTPYRKRPL
uniref:LicD/FKTN/FKRP nucleotidyltransferase domain-containing protein n=1 Tax=Globisporangium ultimum (strain ATCC 200006 / CBS 805.95 / DAOM BR144) TaxID=431595 RepID=K3WTB3_GLOUD